MSLHVALIEPKIPPNTGNIARLCVATETPLHLIEPLGFSLDHREVKRAGLDYWDKVDLWVHPNWFRFRDAISRDRCLYFSANATQDYRDAPFATNSVLVFGSEDTGLPAKILEKHPERCYRIPMSGEVRSLNLANAVSVVLFEGLRKLGIPHGPPPVLDVTDPPMLPLDLDDEEDEVNGNVLTGPPPHARVGAARPGPERGRGGPRAGGAGRGPRGGRGGRGGGGAGRGGRGGGGGRRP
jgi:tRNA (cytidine/uridine-2'-O-)-methyltransferase